MTTVSPPQALVCDLPTRRAAMSLCPRPPGLGDRAVHPLRGPRRRSSLTGTLAVPPRPWKIPCASSPGRAGVFLGAKQSACVATTTRCIIVRSPALHRGATRAPTASLTFGRNSTPEQERHLSGARWSFARRPARWCWPAVRALIVHGIAVWGDRHRQVHRAPDSTADHGGLEHDVRHHARPSRRRATSSR